MSHCILHLLYRGQIDEKSRSCQHYRAPGQRLDLCWACLKSFRLCIYFTRQFLKGSESLFDRNFALQQTFDPSIQPTNCVDGVATYQEMLLYIMLTRMPVHMSQLLSSSCAWKKASLPTRTRINAKKESIAKLKVPTTRETFSTSLIVHPIKERTSCFSRVGDWFTNYLMLGGIALMRNKDLMYRGALICIFYSSWNLMIGTFP